jgi:hypothetical protein
MARTKPATLAGAAALVDYARRDINIGKNTTGWPKIALKTVSTALAGMKGCRMNRHVRLRYGNNMNEDTQSALSRLIRDRQLASAFRHAERERHGGKFTVPSRPRALSQRLRQRIKIMKKERPAA